jgi:hypothetical protein
MSAETVTSKGDTGVLMFAADSPDALDWDDKTQDGPGGAGNTVTPGLTTGMGWL